MKSAKTLKTQPSPKNAMYDSPKNTDHVATTLLHRYFPANQSKRAKHITRNLTKPQLLHVREASQQAIKISEQLGRKYLKLECKNYHSIANLNIDDHNEKHNQNKGGRSGDASRSIDMASDGKRSGKDMHQDLETIFKRTKHIIEAYSLKLTEAGQTIAQMKNSEKILKKKLFKYEVKFGKI